MVAKVQVLFLAAALAELAALLVMSPFRTGATSQRRETIRMESERKA
jgi:hypothetical protein